MGGGGVWWMVMQQVRRGEEKEEGGGGGQRGCLTLVNKRVSWAFRGIGLGYLLDQTNGLSFYLVLDLVRFGL